MMKQTKFITKIIGLGLCVIFLSNLSCNDPKAKSNSTSEVSPLFFKLSLAQWSIHRMIRENNYDPYKFASFAKELGIRDINLTHTSSLHSLPAPNREGYENYKRKYIKLFDGIDENKASTQIFLDYLVET